MPEIRVGCGPFPPQRRTYVNSFSIVELTETFFEAAQASTFRRWRNQSPAGFEFVLGASLWLTRDPLDPTDETPPADFAKREFGFFADTAANAAVWEMIAAQAEALKSERVLFRTPSSFGPSQANRNAMLNFFAKNVHPTNLTGVWEPRGIWSADEISEFAAELGVLVCEDPHVEEEFPEPPDCEAYYALTAPQGRREFSPDDFEDLLDWLNTHEHRVNVFFRGPDRFDHARAFAKRVSAGT
jgi:uncharacterized protein YecE (DUF72 family)